MKQIHRVWATWIVGSMVLLFSLATYGQRIQQDIFDDLVYKSDHYNAKLKKNIFDDLTFTDSNQNTLKFNKAYLEKKMGLNYNEVDMKSMFFQDLIFDYMQINNYEATYAVDLFGTITIEDNQGKKLVLKENGFGNFQVSKEWDKKRWNIQTTSAGDLEYLGNQQTATLIKNKEGHRIYTDSYKTKIVIEQLIWERLLKKHGSEYHVFIKFLEDYLLVK
ncbi:hypothetical protein [Myroides fluvii]|uniref:hypothetical protein n=1 Tax=Myroides fluvii TaxID=2572594 RepID=UPI00131A6FD6|nr:hypothetical protein [Myroides fluvii]